MSELVSGVLFFVVLLAVVKSAYWIVDYKDRVVRRWERERIERATRLAQERQNAEYARSAAERDASELARVRAEASRLEQSRQAFTAKLREIKNRTVGPSS